MPAKTAPKPDPKKSARQGAKKKAAKKAASRKAPAPKTGDGKHRISARVTMEQAKAIAGHGGIDGMLAELEKLGRRAASLEGALDAGEKFAQISRLLEGGGIFLAWRLSTGQLVFNRAPGSPEEIRMFLNRCTLSPGDVEKSGDGRDVVSGFETYSAGMRFLPEEGEKFLAEVVKIASAWFDFNDCGAVPDLGEKESEDESPKPATEEDVRKAIEEGGGEGLPEIPPGIPPEDFLAYGREVAGRCWCHPTTRHLEMDVALAEVFAQEFSAQRAEISRLEGDCGSLKAENKRLVIDGDGHRALIDLLKLGAGNLTARAERLERASLILSEDEREALSVKLRETRRFNSPYSPEADALRRLEALKSNP